jgi:hypothetical protein
MAGRSSIRARMAAASGRNLLSIGESGEPLHIEITGRSRKFTNQDRHQGVATFLIYVAGSQRTLSEDASTSAQGCDRPVKRRWRHAHGNVSLRTASQSRSAATMNSALATKVSTLRTACSRPHRSRRRRVSTEAKSADQTAPLAASPRTIAAAVAATASDTCMMVARLSLGADCLAAISVPGQLRRMFGEIDVD